MPTPRQFRLLCQRFLHVVLAERGRGRRELAAQGQANAAIAALVGSCSPPAGGALAVAAPRGVFKSLQNVVQGVREHVGVILLKGLDL